MRPFHSHARYPVIAARARHVGRKQNKNPDAPKRTSFPIAWRSGGAGRSTDNMGMAHSKRPSADDPKNHVPINGEKSYTECGRPVGACSQGRLVRRAGEIKEVRTNHVLMNDEKSNITHHPPRLGSCPSESAGLGYTNMGHRLTVHHKQA